MTIHGRLALGLALGALIAAPTLAAENPPKLAGTWTWKWKDAEGEMHRHVLEVEGDGAKLTARERFDDEKAIKVDDLKLEGKTISFAVTRNGRYAVYKGKVASADTIDGEVTVTDAGQANEFGWTAKREERAK